MAKKTTMKRSRSESVEEDSKKGLEVVGKEQQVKKNLPQPSDSSSRTKSKNTKAKLAKKNSAEKKNKTPQKSETKETLEDGSTTTRSHHNSRSPASPSSADDQPTLPPLQPEEMMIPEFQAKRSTTDKMMTNRQKCLVLGGRNMSSKARHLLLDIRGLMPHSREHSKLGGGSQHHTIGADLVDICQLHQCNSFLYIDPHRQDVHYMWIGQAPSGPSVKLQLSNVHTADEIRMAGNCLRYSRPLLHFDRAFETLPHLRIVKSLLHMCFNTPRYHPKSKPFIDHIISFFWLDNHIWVRNYQIVYPSSSSSGAGAASSSSTLPLPTGSSSSHSSSSSSSTKKKDGTSLLEIGPRFTLEPVSIFNGCCQGNVVWRSSLARPLTEQRRDRKMRRLEKMEFNSQVQGKSEEHRARHPAPLPDPLDMVFQ